MPLFKGAVVATLGATLGALDDIVILLGATDGGELLRLLFPSKEGSEFLRKASICVDEADIFFLLKKNGFT